MRQRPRATLARRGRRNHWPHPPVDLAEEHIVAQQPSRPNVSQLKDDIQSGRTGDKAPGFDPGASPLGTDDEAAGRPAQPAQIAQARTQEARPAVRNARPNASEPSRAPHGGPSGGLGTMEVLWLVMLGVVALCIFASVMIVSLR
jgi:hypothetical protein